MQVKRNLVRRAPTEEEKANLLFPRDKFELISVDYVDEWDKSHGRVRIGAVVKQYMQSQKAVHITVRCKKCGKVRKAATDRADMSCKFGPCNFNWVDLTGKRFGHLVVDKLDHRKNNCNQRQATWYWRCTCDCGNVCYRTTASLQHSLNAACPKCAFKIAIGKTTLPNGLSKWHRMMRVYAKNAMRCGRVFHLTDEEFIRVASAPCTYCGAPPVMSSYKVVCNGIDRIDNDRGYEPDNVTACCHWCNIAKGKHSRADFLRHVAVIARHCDLKLNDHPEREYVPSGTEMGATQL